LRQISIFHVKLKGQDCHRKKDQLKMMINQLFPKPADLEILPAHFTRRFLLGISITAQSISKIVIKFSI